ncbi:hypothetical protein QYM36_010236 [Artemia franciscana]|uniref:Uncharacterized protein n=1 Tax=Artemia franciscana TaxID=6661 RepID=A0AA88HWY1_ARTSF|nr:hypothetical protein QYM36_010236 [Artemia franciscana]
MKMHSVWEAWTIIEDYRKNTKARYAFSIGGDWNTRIGRADTDAASVIGSYTVGNRYVNGVGLLQPARYNNKCATITLFEHNNLLTWHSNNGGTKSQINHSSEQKIEKLLVRCQICHRLSRQRRQIRTNRFDISKLSYPETKAELELKLSYRFEVLKQLSDVDHEWAHIKTATHNIAEEVLGHTNRKKRIWISDHPIELVEKMYPLQGGAKEPLKEARKAIKLSVKQEQEK